MSILNSRSKEAIHRALNISYFAAVGQQVGNTDVSAAASISEAAQSSRSVDWMNVRLEWSNTLSVQLSMHYRQEYREWNRIIDEVESHLTLYGTLLLPKGIRTDFPESILKNVRRDIVEYVLERHYSLRFELHYFGSLMRWYEVGRIPCGWGGKYPDGKLLIY